MELSMKTVPNATDVCFSSVFKTFEMAAMALPPQIAVPDEIRWEVLGSILNNLPRPYPSNKVVNMDMAENMIPSLPALMAVMQFIPKPKPTTDTCNKICVALWLYCLYGCPVVWASIKPIKRAMGGVNQGVRHAAAAVMNTIFEISGYAFPNLVMCSCFVSDMRVLVSQK